MDTTTHEVADGIFRLSTFVPDVTPDGFTFNQFLIRAEQPLPHASLPPCAPAGVGCL
jgi:hypothetical protein